jgi:hypothetical protein
MQFDYFALEQRWRCPARGELFLSSKHELPASFSSDVPTRTNPDPVISRRMPSSGMWLRVGVVRTDVWDERVASVFRLKCISELGTTLIVTGKLLVLLRSVLQFVNCC